MDVKPIKLLVLLPLNIPQNNSMGLISCACGHLSIQFLLYIDLGGLGSPMDMETDCPLLDDVALLKKTVEDEAIQVARLRRKPV